MEKLEKKKHNHKITDILKVSIFAIVMLAPFIAVGVKCLYTLNPNANQSYYGETINQTEKHTGYEGNDKYYTFVLKELNVSTTTTIDVKQVKVENLTLDHSQEDITQFVIYIASNTPYFRISYQGYNPQYVYLPTVNALATISFYITAKDSNTYDQYMTYYTYNKYSYLDNVFYYAIEEMQNENIFSWAKNTAIYTTIETMTTGLKMNNTIAMLLAYWSLCTAVYIVFDIIIFCFVKLTHFMQE